MTTPIRDHTQDTSAGRIVGAGHPDAPNVARETFSWWEPARTDSVARALFVTDQQATALTRRAANAAREGRDEDADRYAQEAATYRARAELLRTGGDL